MRNFINICGCCMQSEGQLTERFYEPQFEDLHGLKCIDLLKELFPDIIFHQLRSYKICQQCNALLQGAYLLKNLIKRNQDYYTNYIKLLRPANNFFDALEFWELNVVAKKLNNATLSQQSVRITPRNRHLFQNSVVSSSKKYNDQVLSTSYKNDSDVEDCTTEYQKDIKPDINKLNVIVKKELVEPVPSGPVEPKSIQCPHCLGNFSAKCALNNHIRRQVCINKLRCKYNCKIYFKNNVELMAHNKKFHHNKISNIKCRYCQKSFATMTSLVSHESIHQVKPLENQDNIDKKFKCSYCNKCFTRLSNLVQHKSVHRKQNLLKCKYCKKTYVQMYHLQQHEKSHHKKKNLSRCNTCQQNFYNKEEYEAHKKMCTSKNITVNTQPDTHKSGTIKNTVLINICQYCRVLLPSNPENRAKHLAEHIKNRPYKCEKCGYCFKVKAHLMEHMKRVRNCSNSNESIENMPRIKYNCRFCTKSYLNLKGVRYHETNHGKIDYPCYKCSKSFQTKSLLLKHCRTNHNIMKKNLLELFYTNYKKDVAKDDDTAKIKQESMDCSFEDHNYDKEDDSQESMDCSFEDHNYDRENDSQENILSMMSVKLEDVGTSKELDRNSSNETESSTQTQENNIMNRQEFDEVVFGSTGVSSEEAQKKIAQECNVQENNTDNSKDTSARLENPANDVQTVSETGNVQSKVLIESNEDQSEDISLQYDDSLEVNKETETLKVCDKQPEVEGNLVDSGKEVNKND